MRHAKLSAVGLGLFVAFGIGREFAARDERAVPVAGVSAPSAPRAQAARTLLDPSVVDQRLDSPSFAAPSPSNAVRSARAPAAANAPRPRQTALPAAPAREAPAPAAGSTFRIVLEPLAAPPDAVTVGFAGLDTGAPRALDLWRVGAGRPQRLGRARSDGDAQIHGPQLALPTAGIALVVTPLGVGPGEPGASQPLRLARAPADAVPGIETPQTRGAPRWRHASLADPPEGASR